MKDLRRLVVMGEDHRVALDLELVDRLDRGRHQRPLDRRDDALDALIKMRGVARDLVGPFQRWPRQTGRRAGRAAAWGRCWGGPEHRLLEIVGAIAGFDRHRAPPWHFMLIMSIFGSLESRPLRAGCSRSKILFSI